MTPSRRLTRAALLSTTLTLLALVWGAPAYARPAPPEQPWGEIVGDPVVSPPLSGVSAHLASTASLWQLVLVASISAVTTVLLTLVAIRVAAKHRVPGRLVGP